MRHGDARHGDGAHEFGPVQIFRFGQGRARYFHQLVDRHAFGLRVEVGQAGNQAGALGAAFVHAHNAAAAHFQPGAAHFAQRVHAVFVLAGVDDIVVALGVGVEIVVVVIQPGFFQIFGHARFEHAEGAAGFQADTFHGADDFTHFFHILRFGPAPSRAHTETAGAARFGDAGFFEDFGHIHHGFFLHFGAVVRRLRAIFAIFGAAAGFDGKQGGKLDFLRVEILAVHLGSLVNELEQRQPE